ncbi:MAG: hypothetical protein WBM55_14040, partial [Muriicola sp.]
MEFRCYDETNIRLRHRLRKVYSSVISYNQFLELVKEYGSCYKAHVSRSTNLHGVGGACIEEISLHRAEVACITSGEACIDRRSLH